MAATAVNKLYYPVPAPQRMNGSLSGTYTAATDTASADGAVLASGVLTVTPGFVPKYVKVINVTDRITQEWHQGMNVGDFIETAANGVRTLETDDKLSVNATTGVVTITADGGAFTDNDTMVYVIEG